MDLKREVDLIEEIARLHGVDKIPSTASARRDWRERIRRACTIEIADVRRVLAGLGLSEAQGQTLVVK